MRVVLFSGHMVDRPGRAVPRLPASRVPAARRRIEAELRQLGVGAGDRAVASAANGGDLLFAQAWLARRAALEVFLPSARADFLQTSVLPGGLEWQAVYDAVMSDPLTGVHVVPATAEAGEDVYARCNMAMLARAFALADDGVDLLCLWDGGSGDGPGGTEHMVSEVRKRGGRVHWIDSRTLADAASP